MKVKLADKARVAPWSARSIADIKPGPFVGITAMPQPDGTQKAVEIHIFPEAMRGTGEGHRPWDLMPNSTMTNAKVDTEVAVDRRPGADDEIQGRREEDHRAADHVAIVTYAPGTRADLKPGAKIFVAAAKKLPDGTLEAPNITVGTAA